MLGCCALWIVDRTVLIHEWNLHLHSCLWGAFILPPHLYINVKLFQWRSWSTDFKSPRSRCFSCISVPELWIERLQGGRGESAASGNNSTLVAAALFVAWDPRSIGVRYTLVLKLITFRELLFVAFWCWHGYSRVAALCMCLAAGMARSGERRPNSRLFNPLCLLKSITFESSFTGFAVCCCGR